MAELRVGVGAVVLDRGRILLVRRANPPSAGMWSLPGGHLEPGESVEEAALRELEEETGVRGRAAGVVDLTDLFVTDPGGRLVVRYVLIDVLVVPHSLEGLKAGGDALEAAVFPLGEALSLQLTPSTRRFVEKLSKGLCSIEPSEVWISEDLSRWPRRSKAQGRDPWPLS